MTSEIHNAQKIMKRTLCSILDIAPKKLELISYGKVKIPSYGISGIKFKFEDKIYVFDLVKYKNPCLTYIWYADPKKQTDNCFCPLLEELKSSLNQKIKNLA